MSVDEIPAEQDRIVVGVDGSEPSKHALRWARFLAQATGSTIEAVTAWEPLTGLELMGAGWLATPRDRDPVGDAKRALIANVYDVLDEHRAPELEITVREGNPARVLLEVSRGARMLVVGSRGHGGFSGLLLGSVSAACTEHAICPVLVLHGSTPPPPRTGSSS